MADIGDTTTTFVRGNSLELINSPTSTTKAYIHSPRGDTTNLINSDGTYTRYEYSAFGKEMTGNTYAYNPFGYCGEYRDSESGFIYLRNRYYDPSIGRFISEDPIKDGLNWYAYCENDPVNFVDPLGLWKHTDDGFESEEGDSLWSLSELLFGDGRRWTEFGFEGEPGSLQIGQVMTDGDVHFLSTFLLRSNKAKILCTKNSVHKIFCYPKYSLTSTTLPLS